MTPEQIELQNIMNILSTHPVNIDNPMKNLPFIYLGLDNRIFCWNMSFGVTGGFIGLHDIKNDYNIVSTPVKELMPDIIQIAEKWHQKISENLETFRLYIQDIDDKLYFYKQFNHMGDFEKFEKACANLESWLNN